MNKPTVYTWEAEGLFVAAAFRDPALTAAMLQTLADRAAEKAIQARHMEELTAAAINGRNAAGVFLELFHEAIASLP